MSSITIYNCADPHNLSHWQVVNDGVMGGKSQGSIALDHQGFCEFSGKISLENNGGFSMARYRMNAIELLKNHRQFSLKIKGDGRQYQFRVKSNLDQRHSYGYHFATTGDWQQLTVLFEELIPVYRGKQQDLPVYPGKYLQEVAFLCGKSAGTFRLKIKELMII